MYVKYCENKPKSEYIVAEYIDYFEVGLFSEYFVVTTDMILTLFCSLFPTKLFKTVMYYDTVYVSRFRQQAIICYPKPLIHLF